MVDHVVEVLRPSAAEEDRVVAVLVACASDPGDDRWADLAVGILRASAADSSRDEDHHEVPYCRDPVDLDTKKGRATR